MSKTLSQYIKTYKDQLEIGDIQKAYQGLMDYIMSLRTHFVNHYSDHFVVGSIYQGYMDVSYFTITTESLKSKKLKIGIGFNHEKMQFGIWLSGQNRQIQKQYWELFKDSDWNKYHIPETLNEGFAIIEEVLIENPDFDNLESLTEQIETKTIQFVKDITEVFV